MKNKFHLRSTVALTALLFLGACQTTALNDFGLSRQNNSKKTAMTSSITQTSAIKELVAASTKALQDNKLGEASRLINLALKMDITNSDLQFLNGLTYHLMGTAGDASKYDLAEQGYTQALKFDPGNLSAQYQLGLLYMDQRRFGLAQKHFAAVALHQGNDPVVLYSLASASYYARDPKTSQAALKRLMEVAPEAHKNPDVLKAATLSLAAMNDRVGANEYLTAYGDIVGQTTDFSALENRVDGWQAFYDTDAKVLMAQYDTSTSAYGDQGYGTIQTQDDTQGYGGEAVQNIGAADADMVVVDVVLIGTQEDVRNSRGINLLNGLQLQFGDPLTGASGLGVTTTRTKDNLNSGLAQSTQTITRMISIPAVKYSLNIANSVDANNQVLAKPSLVAQAGQTSEFFSGTEILAAAVSGGNGDSVSVQKEVGVKLAVTPEILPDNMLRLHVVAERTFLTDPSNSVVFDFRLDTTKTNVNSTVTMKFDETLILGGLSERETSKSADGVPGLMDIPLINYLFSQRTKREFERSVLILITPRRPQYTRQDASRREETQNKMSPLEHEIERLEQRHKDWFTPRPTFSEISDKLQGREFFEEFRTGDVQIQSWQNDENEQKHIVKIQDRVTRNF